MASRFYVTTPIYYINDVPHLGTAYTTIAADVLARYHRLRGDDTRMLTGTDEHGLKIERAAKERGVAVEAFADEMAAPFRDAWPKLGCAPDDFIRTTEPRHVAAVQEIWRRVAASGDLYLGGYEGWYCVGCEAYYTEKELEPGNVCPQHKKPVERVREPSWFFRLSKYQERLLAFYEAHPEFVQPATRMNEVTSFVRGGLEDLSVSRTTFAWGIPVPGDAAHVMYVWFDALVNYWSALRGDSTLEAFWPPSVHLVGKDILRFHAVYWPAFLMAAGFGDDELPRRIFAHGWLTFDGQKMSKSLRNTVKPVALAEAFGVDTVRYYLMRAIAFGQDGDFAVKDLVQRYNSELGNALGNLLNRVLPQAARAFAGATPPPGEPGELEVAFEAELVEGARAAAEAFDALAPHRALDAIFGVIGAANAYVDKAAPWSAAKRGDLARLGTILATALAALDAIATMIAPVMPSSAAAMRAQLGLAALEGAVGSDRWPVSLVRRKAGEPLGEARPIFPRIDDEKEAALVASLGLGPAAAPARSAGASAKPAASAQSDDAGPAPIAFDDFAKIDLRVGLVVAAEKVAGKDKLLSLKVDLGEPAPRAIVAGLALSFAPDALVGRRVVVVANLEPRKFGKGLVSHGMILASGPSESLSLVAPSGDVPPGTRVK